MNIDVTYNWFVIFYVQGISIRNKPPSYYEDISQVSEKDFDIILNNGSKYNFHQNL